MHLFLPRLTKLVQYDSLRDTFLLRNTSNMQDLRRTPHLREACKIVDFNEIIPNSNGLAPIACALSWFVKNDAHLFHVWIRHCHGSSRRKSGIGNVLVSRWLFECDRMSTKPKMSWKYLLTWWIIRRCIHPNHRNETDFSRRLKCAIQNVWMFKVLNLRDEKPMYVVVSGFFGYLGPANRASEGVWSLYLWRNASNITVMSSHHWNGPFLHDILLEPNTKRRAALHAHCIGTNTLSHRLYQWTSHFFVGRVLRWKHHVSGNWRQPYNFFEITQWCLGSWMGESLPMHVQVMHPWGINISLRDAAFISTWAFISIIDFH